jgi:hypothetical protein
VQLDAARRFALSLPETTEEPHFEKSSFRVRGKIFATVPLGGEHVHLFVEPDEARALLAEDSDAFEPIGRGKTPAPDWVRVKLAVADEDHVCELLEAAWRAKAPKRVVTAFDATSDAAFDAAGGGPASE